MIDGRDAEVTGDDDDDDNNNDNVQLSTLRRNVFLKRTSCCSGLKAVGSL